MFQLELDLMNLLILVLGFKKIKCNMALDSVQSSLKEEEQIDLKFLLVNFFITLPERPNSVPEGHGI
ncbi:MAG: hypothetical protein C0433_00400 [Cyclobacterium sp.]|nr:hypothetical protein [Cyclobacterium sp.]